jgi:transcriptional regulator with XRE-family HTH domain
MTVMKVRELGAFIRSQRNGAQMSLRKLSTLAGVSLPYLSQIERGLRRPSAEIMQAIAKALRISANTLYVQAGILDEHPKPDVHAAVMGDTGLTERQKQALLAVYASFREETSRRRAARKGLPVGESATPTDALVETAVQVVVKGAPEPARTTPPAGRRPAAKRPTTVRDRAGTSRSRVATRKPASGRPETQAEAKPSPGSPSASRSPSSEISAKGGATR